MSFTDYRSPEYEREVEFHPGILVNQFIYDDVKGQEIPTTVTYTWKGDGREMQVVDFSYKIFGDYSIPSDDVVAQVKEIITANNISKHVTFYD